MLRTPRPARILAPRRGLVCRAAPARPPPDPSTDADAGHALLDRLHASVRASLAAGRPHVVALDGTAPSALVAAAVAAALDDDAAGAPALAMQVATSSPAAERAAFVADWLGLDVAVAPSSSPPLASVAAAAAGVDGVAWCGAVDARAASAARDAGVLAPLAGAPRAAVAAAAAAAGVPPGLPLSAEEEEEEDGGSVVDLSRLAARGGELQAA